MSPKDPKASRRGQADSDETWRTWLMTGARLRPIDRRRLRGEHRAVKQMLAEGGEPEAVSRPWRNFSHAMSRQLVNEAMGRLEPRERVVITMAYLAGFTNAEIAEQLGLTGRGVQRSLQQAIEQLSRALGRGRRAALGLTAAIGLERLWRWWSDSALPAGAQAAATAVLVGAVIAMPAPAAGDQPSATPRGVDAGPAPSAQVMPQAAPPARQPQGHVAQPAASSSAGGPAAAGARAPAVATPAASVPSAVAPAAAAAGAKLPAVKAPAVKVPAVTAPKLPVRRPL